MTAFPGDALYQITSPYFCAGITVAQDGAVATAAPIVRWMAGVTFAYVERYCASKNWTLHRCSARSHAA